MENNNIKQYKKMLDIYNEYIYKIKQLKKDLNNIMEVNK
jgi:hypothetical protein